MEIWIDNTWLPSFMSCVRAGDFYRFLDMARMGFKEGACFLCRQGPTIDTRYSETDPTIHMGVAEIQQAAPTVDRTPRLEASIELADQHRLLQGGTTIGGGRQPRSGLLDDSAEDVDFKEK